MIPLLNQNLIQEINNYLVEWHNCFILDYWWRKKYNVAFGSPQHREMNFFDMLIEYQEENNIKKYQEDLENDFQDDEIKMSQKEIDEDYENLKL